MTDKKTTVLITGASSGIGREFARRYAERDCRLILCGRREQRLKELVEELNAESRIITGDLSDEQQCYSLLEQVQDEDIDIFINNAGFGAAGSFLETDLDKEIRMAKVNDLAVHVLFKEILKRMYKKNKGTILNVASSAGLFPAGPYMAGYYASKAYVTSLTRAVAQELREKNSGVRIHVLCPGPVDTEFNQNADVIFSLKGITPQRCVDEALKAMDRGKTVIIPTFRMKAAVFLQRFAPSGLIIRLTGNQQKKKIW